jgi:hypothetical protein
MNHITIKFSSGDQVWYSGDVCAGNGPCHPHPPDPYEFGEAHVRGPGDDLLFRNMATKPQADAGAEYPLSKKSDLVPGTVYDCECAGIPIQVFLSDRLSWGKSPGGCHPRT